jgi:hypothetical protein
MYYNLVDEAALAYRSLTFLFSFPFICLVSFYILAFAITRIKPGSQSFIELNFQLENTFFTDISLHAGRDLCHDYD